MADIHRIGAMMHRSDSSEFVIAGPLDDSPVLLHELNQVKVSKQDFDTIVDFAVSHTHRGKFTLFEGEGRKEFYCIQCGDGRNLLDNENAVIER